MRSTRVPIAVWFCLPMIKSPSQFPGTARSSTSGGRSLMLIMFGMRFLRCPTLRLGRRSALPVHRHTARSRRNAPRDCTAATGRSSRATRRFIASLTGVAVWCIAAATVAYATMLPDPNPVVSVVAPSSGGGASLVGDQWWNDAPAAPVTSAAGTPLWQFLAYGAVGVLLAVAIVGLGHSLSHSRR